MKTILLTAAFLVSSSTAFASLKDKKAQTEQNTQLQSEMTSMNKTCGTKMTGSIDWASFTAGKVDLAKINLGSGYCKDTVSAMEDLCGDAEGKKAVAALKSYTCKFGGKGKRTLSKNGAAIVVTVDIDAGNNKDYFKEQLENKL